MAVTNYFLTLIFLRHELYTFSLIVKLQPWRVWRTHRAHMWANTVSRSCDLSSKCNFQKQIKTPELMTGHARQEWHHRRSRQVSLMVARWAGQGPQGLRWLPCQPWLGHTLTLPQGRVPTGPSSRARCPPRPPSSESICSSFIKRASAQLFDDKQNFPRFTKLPCLVFLPGVLRATKWQHKYEGETLRIYEGHKEHGYLNGETRQIHTS